MPAIAALLERTLEYRRDKFEELIIEIVRAGIIYRNKQGSPITEPEIKLLNGHILEIGFKFPVLWDPDFMASLRQGSTARTAERVDQIAREDQLRASAQSQRSIELSVLKDDFLLLCAMEDRNAAGLALETILDRLFESFGLAPRGAFRVKGEQIDGAFSLHHEIYLVEAKWEKKPLPESALLIFRGKIEGKSAFTRGVFIALEGISEEARDAITRGKQPNFLVINGHDLMMVLSAD